MKWMHNRMDTGTVTVQTINLLNATTLYISGS